MSKEEMEKDSILIVSGETLSVSRDQGASIRILLKVKKVLKGKDVMLGETIKIAAVGQRGFFRGGKQIVPIGPGGHDNIPKKGDRVLIYLEKKYAGHYEPCLPNGINHWKLPACDPVPTARWLTSLYTLQKGKLAFDAENTNRLNGQISLAAKAKVSLGDDGYIIIDQEGFMPVSYKQSAGYETFYITTPLTIGSRILDDYVPYDKDIVVEEDPSMFRKLGEALHDHFTGLATKKPIHHRVEDIFSYPSDHYIWEVGASTVFLKAYQGNDSHGLMLRVCSKATELGRAEIARQRYVISEAKSSAKKEVFPGWGEPLEITKDRQAK